MFDTWLILLLYYFSKTVSFTSLLIHGLSCYFKVFFTKSWAQLEHIPAFQNPRAASCPVQNKYFQLKLKAYQIMELLDYENVV